jgi:uracil-DNA glycosylase family 4
VNPRYVKGENCRGCDLALRGTGFVPADGPPSARLVFMAEAAGAEEVIVGKGLVGAAGGVHTRILHRAGIAREQTRTANTIQCMPPGMWFDDKAPWFYPALGHCSIYRAQTLRDVPDDGVVVALGGVALRTLLNLHGTPGVRVDEFHHTVNRDPSNRFWVVPTFHPSHLQRGAMALLEVVTSAYRLADQIAQQGFQRRPTSLVVDPAPEYVEGFIRDHLQQVGVNPDGTHLSLDTEFERKAVDETATDQSATATTPLTRINLANHASEGLSYPYAGEYIRLTETLLSGLAQMNGIVWLWNKWADWDHLQRAGHTLNGIVAYDGMVAWHYLQSDLPMAMGFVAPLASDFGPWKHWSEDRSRFGHYAAADALQNWRTCLWVFKALLAAGQWRVFEQDWHQRDELVLRPSKAMGVPVDRAALEAFHQDLQLKYARRLQEITTMGAQGTLRPKNGYAKKPTRQQPPKSVLGVTGKKKPGEAKARYVAAHVVLVARTVTAALRVCHGCGKEPVGPKHRCPRPRKSRSPSNGVVDAGLFSGVPALAIEHRECVRWFWQIPFSPSSWQQILAHVEAQGHQPGVSRKTRKPTTDATSLKKLAAETGDPLYQPILDGRAIEKVDGTYAVGTLSRLDADDRVHPEVTPRPSTLRDSSMGPNLQNVIADRGGAEGLAAGFRRCIVARDGVPDEVTDDELTAWEARWR